MLLVVGGIKGGCGKTTLATNLAVCRASRGKKVLLIDADEQHTAFDWQSQRMSINSGKLSDFAVNLTSDFGATLHERMNEYLECYDDVIIDTGGRDTTSQRSAMVKCDAFLTPFRPKSFDIWTLTSLRRMNAELKTINPSFRVMAVLNQCSPRSSDTKIARKFIEENSIECLKTELGYRKSFSEAASLGLGVIELKGCDKKSKEEVESLHDDIYVTYMLNILKKDKKNI